MRAIWSGEISFALVTIPTKLYSATQDLTPKFHLIHKACGTRVQMVRRCPKCERDLAWDEIEKAFEVARDEYARLTKEEIAHAESEEAKGVIELVQFIDPSEVDLAFIDTSYWVGPAGRSSHSFMLLHEVLTKAGRVALSKVALRSRTRLALLRPRGELFSLDMIRFADELVDANELEMPASKPPSERELKLAMTLVDQLTGKFDPEKHPDEYRARIAALVDEKVEHHETARSEAAGTSRHPGGNVIDLSELLTRSLEASGSSSRATKAAHSSRTAKAQTATAPPSGRGRESRAARTRTLKRGS